MSDTHICDNIKHMELWHVFNRGVDKRDIFMDEVDRVRFIHDMYEFNDIKSVTNVADRFKKNSVSNMGVGHPYLKDRLVNIHAYCLMPNHYHLLLSEIIEGGMSLFMKKLGGGYANYFNEKYERSGALWQGKYKRVSVTEYSHELYLPFYIHCNPLDLTKHNWREKGVVSHAQALESLKSFRWSSHLDYLGTKNFPSILEKDFLTNTFNNAGGYEKALRIFLGDPNIKESLSGIRLE